MKESQYLSPNALIHFKLTKQPFAYNKNSKELFYDESTKDIYNQWFNKLKEDEAIYFIDGVQGGGRTSSMILFSDFCKNKGCLPFTLNCSPVTTAINFLSLLCKNSEHAVGTNESVQTLTTNAAKKILSNIQKDIIPIVFMDNCANLQPKVLVEIIKFSNSFYDYFPKSIKLVLIDDYQDILNKLSKSRAKLVTEKKFVVFTNSKLSRQQVEAYIRHKLSFFSAKVINLIINNLSTNYLNETKGNFKAINIALCRAMEQIATLEEENTYLRKAKIYKTVTSTFVLIVIIVAVILFQNW